MFESVKDSLHAWAAGHSDRVKLQHVYIVAAISLLMAAGLLGFSTVSLAKVCL